MSQDPIRVGVLTAQASSPVSDTASQDATADKSGPTIRAILRTHGSFELKYEKIVPDDEESIKAAVDEWASSGDVDLIVTTGGTGFGVRDRTPEAIAPLIERAAPGIVHLLMSDAIKHTPLAALSRPVAGTIKNTFVVTLPGSVKAVTENLTTLLGNGVVNHAVELIRGGSGKTVHDKLAAQGAHVHYDRHRHHHDHVGSAHTHSHRIPQPRSVISHDPSLAATARHRVSPYHMFSLDEALKAIMTELGPLPTEKRRVGLPVLNLPAIVLISNKVTAALKGYILAEDVHASQDVPFTQTTSVDGYALRSTDKPAVYKVVTSATHKTSDPLPSDMIYRINTGGPLPSGTDTIIMVEDTRLVRAIKDEDGHDVEEQEVETLVSVPKGENVREPGSDVRKGDLALQKGELLRSTGGEIGTLAFVGRKEVNAVRKPVVAILSTGNELLDLQDPVALPGDGWGGIWDTNRPSLHAALEGLGYEVVDLGIVADNIDSHVNAIKRGLEEADVLLTTGGTSMGASDLLKPVIEHHFSGAIHFGRVKVKPGKPTTFATIPIPGSNANTRKPLFALPGNPASALVTFHVFVVPALRRLGGWQLETCQLPRLRVKLNEAMRLDSRVDFHRVIIRMTTDGFKAFSTGGQRSSRVASLSGANGLVILPEKTESGPDRLEVGAEVQALIIGELHAV
ncbi:MoaB/Mog domain-containing protein [Amylostereum chailletii]|nr:MoaB/Mog domain-containing protein [Amylostereum chailletii]